MPSTLHPGWNVGPQERHRSARRYHRWQRCAALIAALVLSIAAAQVGTCEEGQPQAVAPPEPYGLEVRDGLHPIGPPLIALRTKLADPTWMVAWLLKPARLRQHQRMRRLKVTLEDARAVTRFLYANPAPHAPPVSWKGGDVRTGETLFVTRGCRGCHTIGATEPAASTAPDLAGIGIKVRGTWLFNWLKSPRAYDLNTAMPQLALSDDDIRHLVAFLLSHREGADVVATVPRFRPRGVHDTDRQAILRFDCPKCHLMSGFELQQPRTEWAVTPRSCATCHLPSEDRTPDERVLENGRMLVTYYNCRGCHRLEGSGGVIADHLERKTFAPPTLEGEGARVQTSWLVDFLQHPKNLRPWLQIRMPDFGLSEAEAHALAKYFAAVAHVPATDERHDTADHDITAVGLRRFTHFKCLQCHPASATAVLPSGVDPEDLSINLMLAKTRLRPSWIRDFLGRPKAVVGTGTRMPAVFYDTDGGPKVDHPEDDIAAITAYLCEMTELPAVTSGSDGTRPREEPIDWTTQPY